ncbi:probable serine/threonine-protein kinase cdc7 [Melanaphis sacchari]|uniref:probable serine/threonine-protein kinase cdc7 n=1 Tax=Melanaphis sacchari TaxID=742174 RepID=UPI000DC12EFD|nr:probable serine/threonine-protein kinase cdc7 [Melanaphis sacchari]
MTTESTDQPLQSAGPLFTDPNARYRCESNDPSCSHGVVARPATAVNMNQVPKGYCYSTDNNQIVNSECDKNYHCPNSTAVVTLTNNIVSTPAAFVSSITVPAGWRRIHNKGVINYISPSNAVLNSLDQAKIYLQTQGTCKCGLECPFQCEHVFNFDAKVMTKPTSGLNTMTNLCNHKRKMMFNNSENRFSKYSLEMAENRRKRKFSGVQQQYSFPPYECEKSGKENFSQVSNSHQMQWPNQSAIPSQIRFSSHGTSAMSNPQSPQPMLNTQGPEIMPQGMQHMVPNSQTPPILNQSSSVMSNSQGPIMPNSQSAMMSNLQGPVMPNSQETVMPNPQGTMIPNTQSQSMGLGNPRVPHYPNHSYQQDLGYEQSYRNGYRYNSSQCRSHETTMLQPDSSCQPHHQQYQNDMTSQEYYQKNTHSMYQPEHMQYNNYDSLRTQGNCRFNCSNHCGHYCNSGDQNPTYGNQINSYQQQPQSQPLRQNESTSHEYYPEMYQDQNNYTESYTNNRNNSTQEYPSEYEYEPQSHQHIDCNLKNNVCTAINNQSPVEVSQIRPQTPQVKQVQQLNTQNIQQSITNPLRPQHRSTPPWQLNKHQQSSHQQVQQQQIQQHQVIQQQIQQQQIQQQQIQQQQIQQQIQQQQIQQQQIQQQISQQESSKQIVEDRVPPIHHHIPQISRVEEKTRKPLKQSTKTVNFGRKSKSPSEEDSYPSFLDDPSGYLAQQTALLNNTISTNSFSPLSPPARPYRQEKPRYTTNVTTMASGRTASSNTITSVLAGRTNTSVVTVNTSEDQVLPPSQQQPAMSKTPLEMVQSVVSSIQVPTSSEKSSIQPSHILLTSNGQFIMASTKIQSPNTSQVLSTVQQQPTVLVNTLQGGQSTLLLQPGNVMTVDQVQVPQLAVATGNMDNSGAFSPRGSNLLSPPDSKRKTINSKKRKSPQISPNQNNSSVLLQPQQQNYNQPVVQTLILPNKTNQYGNQQLITNVIQPVSLVHNLPAIQQFIVPANLGGVVMADNSLLQDAVQLNVITPFSNTGQNILPTGMVLRTPQTQPRSQQSNQFIVNSVGQLSPILANLSPNQSQNQNRNQQQNDYIHVVPCSIQQNQENTTVVQQNTTIVQQQMTMVSGQQSNEQGNLIINEKPSQNYIIADNKQQGFILSPKDKQQSGGTHFILNNMNSEKQTQSFIITSPTSGDKQLCGNFILEKTNSSGNFIITTTNSDKNSKFAKHSVSTQTAAGQQMLQISSTPALIVATNRNAYVGSPPDTTTLSPVSGQSPSAKPEMPSSSVTADLDAALSPSSTLSDMQNRQPMVHCISSSNVVDWSDNSADERKTISNASDSPNMYSIEHSFPR